MGKEEYVGVVYTSGVWDLFHVGHLNIIERASELGNKLVVGVATDEYAASYKSRPIIPFQQRCAIIGALQCVDAVEPVEYHDDMRPMLKHRVTIRAVGPEFGKAAGHINLPRKTIELGIKLVFIPRIPNVSSTLIKQRIKEEWNAIQKSGYCTNAGGSSGCVSKSRRATQDGFHDWC